MFFTFWKTHISTAAILKRSFTALTFVMYMRNYVLLNQKITDLSVKIDVESVSTTEDLDSTLASDTNKRKSLKW